MEALLYSALLPQVTDKQLSGDLCASVTLQVRRRARYNDIIAYNNVK